MKKHGMLLLLIILLFILLCFSLWQSNFGLKTVRYTVGGKGLPAGFEGYRIVQLSDLHSVSFGKGNARLIEKIKRENPNIIVMTGDMVSRFDEDFSVTLALCRSLAGEYPVYYIRGNHEEGLDSAVWENFRTELVEAGVQLLDNETVSLSAPNGDTVNLIGLWYKLDYYHQYAAHYRPVTPETIYTILGDAPEGYNILLAHNPNYFPTYAEWGADLIFSGHIHGGMLRLPLIGGVLSPETILFPEYDGGIYQIHDKTMILSRGLGRGHMGLRLFNTPEIVVVTLQGRK